MRTLLVDDHTLFVEGLRSFLQASQIEVVGTARDGLDALEQIKRHQPDLVLMDIHMPRCTGLEAARRIKTEFPHVRVVMLTMSNDDKDLFEAVRCGVAGYIVKDVPPADFLEMLRGVMQGEAALSGEMTSRLMNALAQGEKKPATSSSAAMPGALGVPSSALRTSESGRPVLSSRQLEILRQIIRGSTYKEIARSLSISERTVHYHMAEILDKLRLQNRSQVIAYATHHRLIDMSQPVQ
jgi:two-component system NarL family response regulator